MSTAPELWLTIDSRLENVPVLGQAVRVLCGEMGLPELVQGDMELCVVEAVTNCIKHSYDGQPGHRIKVHVEHRLDKLIISVFDQGRPIPEDRLPPPPPEVPDDPQQIAESGRGLFLLFSMMDQVDYQRTPRGNCITLIKKVAFP